jgi:hypothetical protein
MPSIHPRSFLSVILVLTITGCGGGSGSSSGSSTAPPESEPDPAQQIRTVALDQAFVQAAEEDVLRLSGRFQRPDALLLSQSPDIGVEVESFEANEISLRTPAIDRPVVSDLQLTFVYGDQSIEQAVSLLAKNTSATPLVQKIQDTLQEKASILELAQDFSLYRFFIDYAYLYDLLTYSEKEQRLAEFSPLDSAYQGATVAAFESLAAELDRYQQGQISDQTLEQALDLTEQSILEHGRYGSRMLGEIQSFVEVLVPGLGSGELVYVSELGIYSRILSTPLYGQVTEGGFEVSEPYQPIESLIRSRKTQSLTCESL